MQNSNLMEKCVKCDKLVSISLLREHLLSCVEITTDDENGGDDNYEHYDSDSLPNREAADIFSMAPVQDQVENELPTVISLPIQHFKFSMFPMRNYLYQYLSLTNKQVAIDVNMVAEKFINENGSEVNPVELLRKMQKSFVIGRGLEITNPEEELLGETNFILVYRSNLIQSAFEEM